MQEIEHTAPNSDHLRTFVAIADCGNLTQAAARLNRTQSAISVQLRKLEDRLNVTLFERQARGMRLTASGEVLLPTARRALAELDRTARLFATPLAGRVRVGLPDDFDDTVLESTLAMFSARHPGVEIVATSGCTARYPDAVARAELDVAISSGPDRRDGDILNSESTVWACGPSLHLDATAPVPLALLDRNCWWRALGPDALDVIGRRWKAVYRCGSFSSLRAAVRAGLAVAPLPAGSVETGMRILGDADGMPPLATAHRAILVSDKAPPVLVTAMVDALRETMIARQ
ncbi:MAG: LysR family transcriptional regulator [Thalassobaculaceae bacterium]|nr:LysR family transcriptional regulator [Thalassobaculaceae bacterium]